MDKQKCPWIQCPHCGNFLRVNHNNEMPNMLSWSYKCMCGENKKLMTWGGKEKK